MDLWMFAQSTDPISGGAGWVGAGLLGAVLAWLMLKHLPDKDKQINTVVESNTAYIREKDDKHDILLQAMAARYDDQLKAVAKTFQEESRECRAEFRAALDRIQNKCREEFVDEVSELRREVTDIRSTLQGLQTCVYLKPGHKEHSQDAQSDK